MGSYCVLNPKVRSAKTGELVDSKLFADLYRAIGYDNARKVYLRVRDDSFVEKYEGTLTKDENGEFTFSSLKKVQELSDMLGIRKRKSYAAQRVDAYKPVVASRKAIADAESRAANYNSISRNEFVALPEIYNDNTGAEIVQIKLVEKTPETLEEASKITRKTILMSRLSNMLSRNGLSSDVIEVFVDRLRQDGMSEYDALLGIAGGLQDLIAKANGADTDVRQSDYISYIVFDALKDNSLMKRLLDYVNTKGLASEILGEEYYDELSQSFGDNSELAQAAVIGLLSQYVLSGDTNSLPEGSEYDTLRKLLDRMMEVVNTYFSKISDREIQSYVLDAQRSPQEYKEKEAKEEYTVEYQEQSDTEEFKETSDKVKKQRNLLFDIIETSVKRFKILSSRDKEFDKTFDKNMTSTLYSRMDEEEYELGVYDFIEASLEQLEQMDLRIDEMKNNPNMSIERRATLLKNIKDFIQSYKVSIDAIMKATYAGVITPNETMSATLQDATFMIGKLNAAYEEMKHPLLVSFVSRFIGTGIEIPFGERAGEKITPEQLLKMADKDISVFDRWLDSMAESGDMMLRMLDATAKKAKGAARLNTIEYKKRIDAIYNRLLKSGIKDTSFMYERDPSGHKTGKYISEEEAKKLDPARRRYWEDMMELKRELDSLLPKGATKLYNIIRIRKDYIERLKGQDSIEGILKETKEALRDKVKRRSDNVEAGGTATKKVLTDFDGNEVEVLPIMFVNAKDGENIDDLSEDTTSSMLMYANMACNYSAMQNTVGLLELVRDHMKERPVQQRAGSKPLVNVLSAFGIDVKSEFTKKGEATNIVQRMNDWFHSQVYSRYMADEGEILGMDVGMLANLSNEVTALNQFALNILSGISNVMTASAMNRIESVCGQYFSVKDLATADKIFWSALPAYIADVGNPVKTSKLALFMEKFNTMQDFESDIREQDYAKSRFGRLASTNSLYVINNAGELWIQNRAALALGEKLGLKDKEGNPISLWDSQEVVIDKDGVARLVTKEGITNANGEAFDDRKDVIRFTNKSKSINQRMNGIYNYEDRNAAQAYAIGRMGLMFRKWIKPSLNRRYSSLNYNFDVEEWEEGFYTTAGRFFKEVYKDLKRGQFDIVTKYKNLDPREKANMVRFAVEVGQFISVCAAFAVLKDVKKKADDDDDNIAKSWWFNQLLYQTRRLETEIGSQMIINPLLIQEALNIIKSPAACVNTWEGVANMTKLMIPSNWTTTLQTGRYKGHTKAYKLFWDSPIIPMHRTIYRGLHPQNSLQFYDL